MPKNHDLTPADLRGFLADAMESSADWRRGLTAQHPNDAGNEPAAKALEKLAEQMRAVPADDPELVAYAAAYNNLADGADGSRISSEMLRDVGFRCDWNPVQEFLTDLTHRLEGCRQKDGEDEEDGDDEPPPSST